MKKRCIYAFLIMIAFFFSGCNNGINIQDDGSGKSIIEDIYKSTSTITINGTDTNDTIKRTTDEDTIIYCGSGNDYVKCGDGYDQVYGEDGNDKIYGNGGNDFILGGSGDDILYAGDSTNLPSVKVCNVLMGEEGNDRLYDGSGRDDIYPGPGDDKIFLTTGTNFVLFHPGDGMNNRVHISNGDDTAMMFIFLPDIKERKTRIYLEPDSTISGTKQIYLYPVNNTNYTLTHAHYDSNNYTNYYVKVNGEVLYIITIKKYTSNSATHWINFK